MTGYSWQNVFQSEAHRVIYVYAPQFTLPMASSCSLARSLSSSGMKSGSPVDLHSGLSAHEIKSLLNPFAPYQILWASFIPLAVVSSATDAFSPAVLRAAATVDWMSEYMANSEQWMAWKVSPRNPSDPAVDATIRPPCSNIISCKFSCAIGNCNSGGRCL